QGDVHVLALTGAVAFAQGEQDPGEREVGGDDVDDRYADPQRPPVRVPVHAHQTAVGLQHRVVARHAAHRAVVAESGDAAVHQPWVPLEEDRVRVQAPPGQGAGLEVLHNDIGRGDQVGQDLGSGRRPQVEGDVAL